MSPWAHVLARNLAVTTVDIDDGTLRARPWNGADFHVVLSTRLLRRWPTRPQLGECLSHGGVGKRGGTYPTSSTHGWRCPKPELVGMGKRERAQIKSRRVRPEVGARSECGAVCRKVRIRRTAARSDSVHDRSLCCSRRRYAAGMGQK